MKAKTVVRGVAVVITVLTFIVGCFAVAYMCTLLGFMASGFDIKAGRPPYVGTISLVVGAAFAILIWWYLAHRNTADYAGLFEPVIHVLEKIAKGQFDVSMESRIKNNKEFEKLVRSVNSMASDLNKIENMRQEFISNVSHEIRSPLASIRGFAQALRNENLSPEKRLHYIGIIETESMRLSRLSDNLLRLAALEAEDVRFEPKTYHIDRQLQNLVLACEPQWTGKEIDLEASLEEIEVFADEDLLSQVWINLLHNAIKFTPKGGKIRVRLYRQDEKIHFEIEDTGVGIPQDAQPYIFERFYKADKARNRAVSGSGLGLAIAKKIIDIHRGTIGFRSKPGEGTVFTVILPE